MEWRIKPIACSIAAVQAKSCANTIICETVISVLEETGITGEQLETVTSSEDGRLTSINSDTVTANKLKNLITLRTQEALENMNSKTADIPLGTIIGGELLRGTGPSFPVRIALSGSVESDFDSSFESGGINQTVHRLSVTVSADINIIMPFVSQTEKVTTSVLIGETVIIGETPEGMLVRY